MIAAEVQAAIELIARHVANVIIDNTVIGDYWEDFPEIGEDDWTRVAKAVTRHATAEDYASRPEFEAAYKLLASRADQ